MVIWPHLVWFPLPEDIHTAEYFVSEIRIVHQGAYPDSVHLVIVHPEQQILYFVAAKDVMARWRSSKF